MKGGNSFEDLVKLLPVRWEKALGAGLSYFINNQEPEEVEFKQYNNGYAIIVRTDEVNVEEAREFWEKFVDDKI